MIPDEIGFLKKLTRKKLKAKKVMLNHGFCFLKNGKRFYHKSKFPLNDLIISTSEKHKKIFTEIYGYSDIDVAITGYPRLDDMVDESTNTDKKLLLMPTFRDNEDNIGSEFSKTTLFEKIKNIMTDPILIKLFEKEKIKLSIYLHQNIQKYSYMFDEYCSENIKVVKQGGKTVQDLLKESNLLITDYSSVMFDFIYMSKPFISYQFDREDFINSRDDKPIINIKNDLPGHVVDTHDELVSKILEIHNENYKIDPESNNLRTEYFYYSDRNNCKRVFDEIKGSIDR